MLSYYYVSHNDDYLAHHGILGMKWGVRRYQNEDGTLTEAGKRRYGTSQNFKNALAYKQAKKDYNKAFNDAYNHNHPYSLSKKKREESKKRWDIAYEKAEKLRNAKQTYKESKAEIKEAKRPYKEAIKQAKKDYNKAFNDAYNHNHPYSLSKKKREESKKRWDIAYEKVKDLNIAEQNYKDFSMNLDDVLSSADRMNELLKIKI